MLELFGKRYVIDHMVAEHNQRGQEQLYRAYTSDVLKAIAESIGVVVYHRYEDLIATPSEEEKTADEIAMEVMKKAGLRTKDGCSEFGGETKP